MVLVYTIIQQELTLLVPVHNNYAYSSYITCGFAITGGKKEYNDRGMQIIIFSVRHFVVML